MCRLAAWVGRPIALERVVIDPPHSLLEQSLDATEAKLAVNGDGFGFAWYTDGPEPGLFRDVLPAWSDGNLPSLCRMIKAPVFLAHVRASTVGETSRVNCHPFVHGRWSFMHNGQIGNFLRVRRTLEAMLPDALYLKRAGTTDSELIFLLMIAAGLEDNPLMAIRSVFATLTTLCRAGDPPSRLTCVLSDGEDLIVVRHASDAKAPTLYYRETEEGHIFASEPLDGRPEDWMSLPQNTLVRLSCGALDSAPLQMSGQISTDLDPADPKMADPPLEPLGCM